MSWNYRIMRHERDGNVWYGLHEYYFGMGRAENAWSTDPEPVIADTAKELIEILKMMLSDAKKCKNDILEYGGEDDNT